jgi:hypothetical protein
MKKQWFADASVPAGSVLLATLVGTIVGFAEWQFDLLRNDIHEIVAGVGSGLIVYFAIEIALTRVAAQRAETCSKALMDLLRAMDSDDPIAEITLIWGLKRSAKLIGHGVSVESADLARLFWVDCIGRAQSRWRSLNYANNVEWWAVSDTTKHSLMVQAERKAAGCDIKRIFCVDKLEEALALRPIMEQQDKIGIEVTWVLKADLLRDPVVTNAHRKLGGFDVAAVDTSWVYLGRLTANRDIAGASLIRDASLHRAAITLFTQAETYERTIAELAIESTQLR